MNKVQEQEGRSRKSLEDLLKTHVECPVCFEVPRTGPIYACPNGHHVCKNCKKESCPICREVMGNNKSLLAVEVIENVLHKCKFVKCEDVFPLGKELTEHERICKHRKVSCPRSDCDKEFPLSDLLEHLGNKTCCFDTVPCVVDEATVTSKTFNAGRIAGLKDQIGWKLNSFIYKGTPIVLCVKKSDSHYYFYVVMFECEEVCSKYVLELEVFKHKTFQVFHHKVQGIPISIDTAKSDMEHLGLSVHQKVMEMIVPEDDDLVFTVSFSFF